MLKGKIAFRTGTAINKLLFKQPLRCSEGIDLVSRLSLLARRSMRFPKLCHGSARAIVSRPDIRCTGYPSSRPKLA
jgi:hypothetical protein